MSNAGNSAKTLAQMTFSEVKEKEERAKTLTENERLLERLGRHDYNFRHLLEVFEWHDDPRHICHDLLQIYFEFVGKAIQTGEDYSYLSDALYSLRLLYEAISKMEDDEERFLQIALKDNKAESVSK